jgi:hypothetical protein
MEHRILIEFPVKMDIENNDDPFIIEGKGWFKDKLINWKIIMSEKTGIRNWLGAEDYAKKKIILNEAIEGEFLGLNIDRNNINNFISVERLPKSFDKKHKEESYVIFRL